MPKPNYGFEKRQRELEKKRKKAEKDHKKSAPPPQYPSQYSPQFEAQSPQPTLPTAPVSDSDPAGKA